MSEDFKPGTRPLLRLAGLDAMRAYVSRAEEAHAIWSAVLAVLLRLHQEPDAQARRESGPTDSQVVAALRVVLSDHFGTEAADYASWALVRYGCRQKPTMAALHPWEGLMFEWQQRRATAPRIALMLRDAGLDKPLTSTALECIDRWVADPAAALGEATGIIEALFGDRLVSYDLRDDGSAPAHDTLFGGLVASALPQARLARLSQARQRGADAAWRVEYTFADTVGSFEARPKGALMDVDAVMGAVDDLLARIGRPERVYRLAAATTARRAPSSSPTVSGSPRSPGACACRCCAAPACRSCRRVFPWRRRSRCALARARCRRARRRPPPSSPWCLAPRTRTPPLRSPPARVIRCRCWSRATSPSCRPRRWNAPPTPR